MSNPAPWACSRCGARLLWRRTSLDCPTHGPLCTMPAYPDDREEQQQ